MYEATGALLLFFGLLWIFKRRTFDGQVFLSFFIVYPVLRGIIECYRGDSVRGFVLPGVLSTSQFLSLLLLVAALFFFVIRWRNSAPPGQARETGASR